MHRETIGAQQPSHSLLDLVSQQFEAQQLAYLSPDRCTSREWAVAMGKTSKQIQLDTDHLVVKEKSDTPDQVAATEMQIYEALRRPWSSSCFRRFAGVDSA